MAEGIVAGKVIPDGREGWVKNELGACAVWCPPAMSSGGRFGSPESSAAVGLQPQQMNENATVQLVTGSTSDSFYKSQYFCCLVSKSCLTLSWPDGLLSIGYPRQKYWSGLPFTFPGDLPNPEIEPTSPALAGGFFTTEPLGSPSISYLC